MGKGGTNCILLRTIRVFVDRGGTKEEDDVINHVKVQCRTDGRDTVHQHGGV